MSGDRVGKGERIPLEMELGTLMEVYKALVATDLEAAAVRRFVDELERTLFDRLSMEEMAKLAANRKDA